MTKSLAKARPWTWLDIPAQAVLACVLIPVMAVYVIALGTSGFIGFIVYCWENGKHE